MNKIVLFLFLALSVFLGSCKKDSVSNPVYGGSQIDAYDLLQVTNANAKIPVTFSFSSKDKLDSIEINVYPQGTSTAKNVLRKVLKTITKNSADALIYVDYPSTAVAPTGIYTILINMYNGAGVKKLQSYDVNIQNNQTSEYCDLPPGNLPTGKNVWVRVYTTLPVPASDNVYITGSFEAANGGPSDWTGGNNTFKMNRLSNNCFYIALNLTSSNEFKFTNGDWNREALLNDGGTPGNMKWNGKDMQTVIIYNWKGKALVQQPLLTSAQVLPAAGIQFGGMSVIADVNTYSDTAQFYLVKKGMDLNDKTFPMYRVSGTTQVIGSVPKDLNATYYVVKNGKEGVSRYGFERSVSWDGKTNPVSISTPNFKGDASILTVPTSLFIVGDATPGGWSNPVPTPSQQFTNALKPTLFEITLPLTSGGSYLLLPVNGSWDHKFGGKSNTGGILYTDNDVPGSNTPAPAVSGNYKISADFSIETYTVTKQ